MLLYFIVLDTCNMFHLSRKRTFLNDFKRGLQHYLRETTVHGFRYLIDGRNVCEIVVWISVITFCFVITFCGIYVSIRDSYNNPILTSVQTTHIQTVRLQHFYW